jgi:cell division protein FtsI/penicillin-binding protein 2
LLAPLPEDIGATPSAEIANKLVLDTAATISAKLTARQSSWIPLARNTLETAKQTIQNYNYKGIGFEESEIRQYPEASMAAQLLGFVGSDGSGKPKGYFGLEGRYNFRINRPGRSNPPGKRCAGKTHSYRRICGY